MESPRHHQLVIRVTFTAEINCAADTNVGVGMNDKEDNFYQITTTPEDKPLA